MSEPIRPPRPWYQRVGPGLITACVVIGPGSILTSSQVGAEHGFAMLWVVVVAVIFMMVYTSLGAKLGVATTQSPGDLVAQRAGRPLAVMIGLGVFFISAAFQFGNNLGVHSAFNVYIEFNYTIVIFNAVAIAFLFAFKNLYRAVERLMMVFVGVMLIAFTLNLIAARPDWGQLARGFLPSDEGQLDWATLGLVGTTFVITASYFQAYLVRQKGWGRDQMADGLRDARIGALIMAVITLMLMSTAAAVLTTKPESVEQVAEGLRPLFSEWGRPIFCLGLFSAAFSSFLVNSMIGGFILSDGLGLGSKPTDLGPKVFTTAALLTGMGVALVVILKGWNPFIAIVSAQAVTVIVSPLVAGTLLWLTNRRDVMGEHVNGVWTNVLAACGFLLLLAMGAYTAVEKVGPAVKNWLDP
ncbi:MAG: Nramp family divalent metal transporter [Planctomycetes bacterium]|nr:Nramp family divalent metal transporter [Planctomycetota bacterium]